MKVAIKTLTLTLLLFMYSYIAYADVINYGVQTNVDGKPVVKEFNVKELTDDFLKYQEGDEGNLYEEFLSTLKKGKFVYFEDHKRKVVDYNYILDRFLDVDNRGMHFDLNKVMDEAPAMAIKPGTNKVTTKTTTALQEEKDRVDAGVSKIQKSLADINMPVMTKTQSDEINKDFTSGHWHTNIGFKEWYDLSKVCERFVVDAEYAKLKNLQLDTMPTTVDELREVEKRNKLIKSKYMNNSSYKYLTDMSNYKNLKGSTIDFSKVSDVDRHLYNYIACYDAKDLTGIKDEKGCQCIKRDGFTEVRIYPDYCEKYFTPVIWRPDMERGMIEEINKIRTSKGMKSLEYDANLHAMSRYCAKRNHYSLTRGFQLTTGQFDANGFLKPWANGSVAFAFSNKVNSVKSTEVFTKIEGNEKKLFNYNGHLKAMCCQNPTFSKPKDFLDYWEYYKNPTEIQWKHGHYDLVLPYDEVPNMDNSLLNPNMTKIGVGYVWEAPNCLHDLNGANGVFILVE